MPETIERLRQLYDEYQRKQDSDARSKREDFTNVVRFIIPEEKAAFVLYSKLSEIDADEAIQQHISYFREQGYEGEWKYYDYDTPEDLPQRLEAYGLAADDAEAIMVLPIADAPQKLLQPVTHDIRRVTEAAQFQDADAVHEVIWGKKDGVSNRVLAAWQQAPNTVTLYIAYVDDKPVSYGRIEFPRGDNPFASIWGGSTLPEYRNRGIYSALVAMRLQEAISRGRQYLTVDATPDTSMPILQKLGFVTIAYSTPYTWSLDA
jgi:ribosomal protein S18 acetylase RimI-like enzyme